MIDEIIDLMRSGHNASTIKNQIRSSKSAVNLYTEIAKARINIEKKFRKWNRLWMDLYSSSFSTPEIVGDYRSGRIKQNNILDVGSGSGMQAISFSKFAERVTGIEINRDRYEMSIMNGEVSMVNNIKFIWGDYSEIIHNTNVDVDSAVFSDPLRIKPGTDGKRNLIPSPEIIYTTLKNKTENFIFDLPPLMKKDDITIKGEKEYISVEGKLQRLTLYTGENAESETSAVLLPQGRRFTGNPMNIDFVSALNVGEFIYLPDVSLIYSGLLCTSIPGDLRIIGRDSRRILLTGNEDYSHDFPGESYNVLCKSQFSDLERDVKKFGGRRVYFRFEIETDSYYQLKNSIEKNLHGEKDVYVFMDREGLILAEKILDNGNSDETLQSL
ncbi:hypothetical protein OXIME_000836 [Oxyplasma meridianum]|uniref:Methyltransferase domain-containing protein n=1 Tax=Oxyplasma meridianum TaxID=3073602 RepID=A0AAX4NFJ6_9ARCH